MNVLIDANIFLAVILNEPEKKKIIELSKNIDLISPEILPYEIGNALSAMLKKNRLYKNQLIDCYRIFNKIPIRLISVDIEKALEIASDNNIYAYDAYYLEIAKRLKINIMTLDLQMKKIAGQMNIPIMEVL